mgnify:FL=1
MFYTVSFFGNRKGLSLFFFPMIFILFFLFAFDFISDLFSFPHPEPTVKSEQFQKNQVSIERIKFGFQKNRVCTERIKGALQKNQVCIERIKFASKESSLRFKRIKLASKELNFSKCLWAPYTDTVQLLLKMACCVAWETSGWPNYEMQWSTTSITSIFFLMKLRGPKKKCSYETDEIS